MNASPCTSCWWHVYEQDCPPEAEPSSFGCPGWRWSGTDPDGDPEPDFDDVTEDVGIDEEGA